MLCQHYTSYLHRKITITRWIILCTAAAIIVGCSTKKQRELDPVDPIEGFNRGVYKFNSGLDAMYMKPAAYLYKKTTPAPVRNSVGNFINNLTEVPTTINQLLQGKPKQAGNDFLRLAINSTFGIFGLFDVATPIGLPRHREDLGQTFAAWGYKKSAYLVIPIIGPSTVRDGIGFVGNTFMTVPYYFNPRWRNRYIALFIVHKRDELRDLEDIVHAAGVDEYAFVRNAYLQRKDYDIKDSPEENVNGLLDEPPD